VLSRTHRTKVSRLAWSGTFLCGLETKYSVITRAISQSVYVVATGVKPVLGILGRYPGQRRLQGGRQRLAGAGGGGAQAQLAACWARQFLLRLLRRASSQFGNALAVYLSNVLAV